MTSWEHYSNRRKIDFEAFIHFNKLYSKEDVVKYLQGIAVGPPPDELLEFAFLSHQTEITVEIPEPIVQPVGQSKSNKKFKSEVIK